MTVLYARWIVRNQDDIMKAMVLEKHPAGEEIVAVLSGRRDSADVSADVLQTAVEFAAASMCEVEILHGETYEDLWSDTALEFRLELAEEDIEWAMALVQTEAEEHGSHSRSGVLRTLHGATQKEVRCNISDVMVMLPALMKAQRITVTRHDPA